MIRYPHIMQQMFNRPLYIHPGKIELIVAAMAERVGIASSVQIIGDVNMHEGANAKFMSDFGQRGRTYDDVGYELLGPIARIQIEGTLVQKLGTMRPYSGMTGYDGIRYNFLAALQDPQVRGIALDINSPGGDAAGCLDLCDTIYSARGTKPVWAILSENAFSAAYALGCAADRITVPRTGGTGSIGVIWCMLDYSEAIKDHGIKVTIIKHGDRKADGRPEIPMSDEALARFQRDVDLMGDLLDATVARNRGMAISKIRDMQASTYMGQQSVDLQLADDVLPPDAAFEAFLDELGE